jgi:hypothetical protein
MRRAIYGAIGGAAMQGGKRPAVCSSTASWPRLGASHIISLAFRTSFVRLCQPPLHSALPCYCGLIRHLHQETQCIAVQWLGTSPFRGMP